ncbi:MAG TPA: T9SS type A sorting domain-containing protein, partial [Candidatus Kapabacteria bacterium]
PLCDNSADSLLYVDGRGSQEETWFNSVDTSKVPLDTTIYSLHDLGLDSVLKYAALLGVSEGGPSIITNASAYPNPTGTGTVLTFGTAKEAYVIVNLYDVLGHTAGTAHCEGSIQPGNHSIPLSLIGLPPGTYFARIQTTYGEVQSVKIVKE